MIHRFSKFLPLENGVWGTNTTFAYHHCALSLQAPWPIANAGVLRALRNIYMYARARKAHGKRPEIKKNAPIQNTL
jgi:hypothetical protein